MGIVPPPTMVGGGNQDWPPEYGAAWNLNLQGGKSQGVGWVVWGGRCSDGVWGSPGAWLLLFLTREEETSPVQAEGEEFLALCSPPGTAPTSCQTRGLGGLARGK